MKTLIITISTIAIMFNSAIENNTISLSETRTLHQIEQTQIKEASISVKACYYKGEIIPSVQLPTFNVVGETIEGSKVVTTMHNGERIPLVILPELNIVS